MKGLKTVAATSVLLAILSGAASAAPISWETGQGLVEACSSIQVPKAKATDDDVASMLACLIQFRIWRDAWVYADEFNKHKYATRGPVCIPQSVMLKALVEGYLGWAKTNMTGKLKTQPSSASLFKFSVTYYPCA